MTTKFTTQELLSMFTFCTVMNQEVYSDCGSVKITNIFRDELDQNDVNPDYYQKGILASFEIASNKTSNR